MKADQIKKIAEDPEIREHALSALKTVKKAVDEARADVDKSSKKAQKKLKKSKEQDKQKTQAVAAEVVGDEAAPKKKKCRKFHRLFLVAFLGTMIALIVSADARKVFLDALFGAEEEFQYTSEVAGKNGSS
jgi:Fe2+ transport system protein B